MADLSGVLRKTIDGLPRATPQMREKVYEKARAAIQRQIDAANPPLAEQVVSARLSALEDAISRTEAHYAEHPEVGEAGSPAPAAAQPAQPQPPARPAPPVAQAPAAPSPEPKPAPGAAPAARQPQPAQPPRPAGAENRAPAEDARATPPQQPQPPRPAPPAPQQTPRQMPPMGDANPASGPQGDAPKAPQPGQPRPTLPAATMPTQRPDGTPARPAEPAAKQPEPFFPPETAEPDAGDLPPAIGAPFIVPDERRETGAPSPASSHWEDDGHEIRDDDDGRVPHDIRIDDGDIPEADVTAPRYPTRRAKRSGRGGKIAAAAVVVLALAGAGTVGWLYRADLEALLVGPADIGTIAERSGTDTPGAASDDTASTGEAPPTETAAAESDPASTRRFTQRLMPDGTEVDEGPAQQAPNAFDEGTNVAAATTVDESAQASGATPTISSEIGEDPAVVGADAGPAAGETPAAEIPGVVPADPATPESESAAPSSGQLEVAQKAVFYQEKTEDLPGTQETGTAVWSLVEEPGTDGQAGDPAIRAVVDVPVEKLKLTMTIKRNSDPTLPASHVIELEFEVPPDFSGGSVANVQRLALKETEQARGEPLIGVAGKISDNYFIIALNNLDQAVQNNLSLLGNQKWIDIPVAYQSGRRALISLEKGIPGERVFRDALKAWQPKT
ncbi:MAG: hypothetical protein CMP81_12120 [Fulvimarina sp.]|nr:hypothetical protein [Fulvimarina sp.]